MMPLCNAKKTFTNFYISALGLHEEVLAKRNYTIAMLKHIAYFQMRRDGYKIVEIASIFNVDHSTVIYAINKIANSIEIDKSCELLYKYYVTRLISIANNYMTYYNDIRNFDKFGYKFNKYKFKKKDN